MNVCNVCQASKIPLTTAEETAVLFFVKTQCHKSIIATVAVANVAATLRLAKFQLKVSRIIKAN